METYNVARSIVESADRAPFRPAIVFPAGRDRKGHARFTQLTFQQLNDESDRYEIEFWGYGGNDLRDLLDTRGRAAFDRGELVQRPDLIKGSLSDFARAGLDDSYMIEVAPESTMHPILPDERPSRSTPASASACSAAWTAKTLILPMERRLLRGIAFSFLSSAGAPTRLRRPMY